MTFLKQVFGSSSKRGSLKKAEAEYSDAVSKLADTHLDLYIALMKIADPALKEEDLDMKSMHSLVLGAEVARQHSDDATVFGLGAKALADKTWQVRFVALQILRDLGLYLVGRKEPPSPYAAAGRKPIPLETVVQTIRLALTDPDQRIQETAKYAIAPIETSQRLSANK
jgi:hypothetical protein